MDIPSIIRSLNAITLIYKFMEVTLKCIKATKNPHACANEKFKKE
jgi:hypothetical protein